MIDFHGAKTGNSLRAAIALGESGLPWKLHPVDLRSGAHKTPEFLRLNSVGRLPVIVDHAGPGGVPLVLTQSAAIVLYIAERAGRMLSRSGIACTRELEWLSLVMTDIVAPMNLAFFMGRNPVHVVSRSFLRQRALDLLPIVDKQLEQNEFLAGDSFSVADCAGYPAVSSFDVQDLGAFENILRWKKSLSERPSVRMAYQDRTWMS